MNKMEIKIKKLFGKFDYDIKFDNKVNVIVGNNGCGKTTILRIIDYVIKKDYLSLSKIRFSKIELYIDNDISIIKYNDIKRINVDINDYKALISELIIDKEMLDLYEIKQILTHKRRSGFDRRNYSLKERNICDDIINEILDKIRLIIPTFNIDFCSKKGYELICQRISNKIENIENKFIDYNTDNNFFTFIDLDEERIIKAGKEINDKGIKILKKYLIDKNIEKVNDRLVISDINNNLIIPLNCLSSGEKKMILLSEIMGNAKENQILLLDEPELSLSYVWEEKLIESLLEDCSASKILIATQSETLLTDENVDFLILLNGEVYE